MANVDPIKAQLKAPLLPNVPKLSKTATSLMGQAESVTLDAGALSGATPWIGAGLLLILCVGGFFWWKKKAKKSASQGPPEPKPKPGPDAYKDWREFRAQLPARLRRGLDQFQPVVVLGDAAAEKEAILAQFSGLRQQESLYPGLVKYRGEALEILLGHRTLVLNPSESFLGTATSSGDPSWRRVLARVTRVHAPTALVCLSQASLESTDQDRLSSWAAKLRAQIDTLCEVRGEDVGVEVVIAQSVSSDEVRLRSKRISDSLFGLLNALRGDPKYRYLLSVPLDGLREEISVGAEQRKVDAQKWITGQLSACRQGWPALLAQPQQSAQSMLRLAHLFEDFTLLTGSLGVALAELFVNTSDEVKSGQGRSLTFLPAREGSFIGQMSVFDPPEPQQGERWHPTGPLLHRLALASVTGVLSVGLFAHYYSQKQDWKKADEALHDYEVTDPIKNFSDIENFTVASKNAFSFFDGAVIERAVECKIRKMLKEKINAAVGASEGPSSSEALPEDVIRLIALFVTGNTDKQEKECSKVGDNATEKSRNGTYFKSISDIISNEKDQWKSVTGLTHEELSYYLASACPTEGKEWLPSLIDLNTYGEPEGGWLPEPELDSFLQELEEMLDKELPLRDRAMVDRVVSQANELAKLSKGKSYKKLRDVFWAVNRLNTSRMNDLTKAFRRFESRLKNLSAFSDNKESINQIVSDVRSFSKSRVTFSEGRSPLRVFREKLDKGQAPLGLGNHSLSFSTPERPTTTIDRDKLRARLQARELEKLEDGFIEGTKWQSPASVFFSQGEIRKQLDWIPHERWPRHVLIQETIPWYLTREGFKRGVLEPLVGLKQAQNHYLCPKSAGKPLKEKKVLCPGGGESDSNRARQFDMFLKDHLNEYLEEYNRTWRDVFNSFTICERKCSDYQFADTMAALARPSSPLLTLLRETSAQISLPTDEDFPYPELLSSSQHGLRSLAPALEDKTLKGYTGLLNQLADYGASCSEGDCRPVVAEPMDAEASLQKFGSTLKPYGRMVWAGLRTPEEEVRQQVDDWAADASLAPSLKGPFLEPFKVAHGRGVEDIRKKLSAWWRQLQAQLQSEILGRFPFEKGGKEEASVLILKQWLHPVDGRLVLEIEPVVDAIESCPRKPCAPLPQQLRMTMERLRAVQDRLFDEDGAAKPFVFSVQPVRFVKQEPTPGAVYLEAQDVSLRYFNTVPSPQKLKLQWNETYNFELRVTVAGHQGVAAPASLLTESSPWAFLHLLKRAKAKGSRFTWALPVSRSERSKEIEVSYDVCAGVRACDGLFSKVFAWRKN